MQNARAYACSSRTNGGKYLCANNVTVRREVAENAILANVKTRLLSDEVIEYVTERFEAALRNLATGPSPSEQLAGELRSINAKLVKLADAIEAVGISDTLALRLARLEAEKAEIEDALEVAELAEPAELQLSPEVIPALVGRWRDLVSEIENISKNPDTTADDVEAARAHLRALLGPITLEPRDGVLWAHPSQNGKSLVETRLSDGLSINSPKMVAGARLRNSWVYTQSPSRW